MSVSNVETAGKVQVYLPLAMDMTCPGCGAERLWEFYTVRDVPVSSCVLMNSREEALDCGRGDVRLAYCENCGFVSNTAFDAATQDFGAQYEGSQAASGVFNEFATSLARRLIDRYDIRHKSVLEIGCGRGKFLSLICRLGNNRGIGIDPAYTSGNGCEDGGGITFISDYYSSSYHNLSADMICCRHTLEHISEVREFLDMVRSGIRGRAGTVVFFEVPNALRILRAGAFWDVYYEHCNYFTSETLRGLFVRAGFEIDEVYTDYGGQYLILTARPSDAGDGSSGHSILGREDVRRYVRKAEGRIRGWNTLLGQMRQGGKRVVTWGSSSNCVSFLTTVDESGSVEYVVDINPRKEGMYMAGAGHRIVGPEFLRKYRPEKVIVINPVYVDEIGKELERLGLEAELLPITSV